MPTRPQPVKARGHTLSAHKGQAGGLRALAEGRVMRELGCHCIAGREQSDPAVFCRR